MTEQAQSFNEQNFMDMYQICEYMDDIKIKEGDENKGDENKDDEYIDCEVDKIYTHRVTSEGKWQFQVGWKDCITRDWVDDESCKCEKLIAKYLSNNNIKTAYLFCRVSTPSQATSVNVSLGAQEIELRKAVAMKNGFDRVRVYQVSESAYKNIPKILQHIGEACLPSDAIFFWRVDRISRNIVKYLSWLEELNERGVMLYSHDENITYKDNKLSFLRAIIEAQHESELLGKRIKLSYKRKRSRGDERVGRLPYGKQYNRVLDSSGNFMRNIVVDNPEETEVIDRIKRSKKAAIVIASELNSEGIYKKNKLWNKAMVMRIKRMVRQPNIRT